MENKKAYSEKQESTISAFLGWKRVSGSGARPTYPGDIIGGGWLGECKTHITPNSLVIFEFKIWDKLLEEANSRFLYPVLFCDDGSQLVENTLCMFDVTSEVTDLDEFLDYSDKSSIRFSLEKMDISKFFTFFKRTKNIYCIMSLELFKEYIKAE